MIGSVRISGDESVFTSGTGARFRQASQVRYPHVLNPQTGWPVEGLFSATVVSTEGTLADAAATALLVAGPVLWPQTARAMGLDMVLLIDYEGQVFLTPEMDRRVDWVGDAGVKRTVVPLDE